MGKVGETVQLGTLINNAYSDVGQPLTSAHLFVGNASNVVADVAVSGALTMDNTGAFTIAAGGVLLASLATGVKPSHIVKFAANQATTGGSATLAVTVTGVAATDIVLATIKTVGGTPRTIVSVAATLNTITFVFSGDPSTDHVVAYQVLRAAA